MLQLPVSAPGLSLNNGGRAFQRPLAPNDFDKECRMKNSRKKRHLSRLVVVSVAIFAVAALGAARSLSGSVRIVNNSNREIRNVYFSHVDADDWGSDQLGENNIAAGQSYTISNITWDQQQLKV